MRRTDPQNFTKQICKTHKKITTLRSSRPFLIYVMQSTAAIAVFAIPYNAFRARTTVAFIAHICIFIFDVSVANYTSRHISLPIE